MSYESDRSYGEKFIPRVRELAGPHLLEPSLFEEDAKRATDLVVLRAKNLTLGVRIRRPKYESTYPFDFTIRSKRDTGTETELSKIRNGWMDWLFYGHDADLKESFDLARWMLLDMSVWRREAIKYGFEGLRTKGLMGARPKANNGDGTYFETFDVRAWPRDILVAASKNITDGCQKNLLSPARKIGEVPITAKSCDNIPSWITESIPDDRRPRPK